MLLECFFSKALQKSQHLMLGLMMIPVHQGNGWQSLKFSALPQNKVSHNTQGLLISVNKSSSPLIYPLPQQQKVKSVRIKGKVVSGSLVIPKNQTQGDKSADDFILKVGLVKKGKRTLNWVQRQVAPDWVLKLYSLAPKGTGVEHIDFVALGSQKKILNRKRTHPLSELLFEDVVTSFEPGKPFELSKTYKEPIDTLALWISADGDDTGSSFKVLVESIELSN